MKTLQRVQSVKKVVSGSSKTKKSEKNGRYKNSSKDKKRSKKSKDDKKSHKKKKGKKSGPAMHYTANAEPQIAIDGDLDPLIFQQCKEKMRPVKKALKLLGSLDPDNANTPRQETECLLKIGARIQECIKPYSDETRNKEWRNHLWTFVAKFTEYSPRRIYKMYKNALKGTSSHSTSHHEYRHSSHASSSNSYMKSKNHAPYPEKNHHYSHHPTKMMQKRPNDPHSLSPNKRPRQTMEDGFDGMNFPGFPGFPSVPPHLPPPVSRSCSSYGDAPNRRNIPPPMRVMPGHPSTSSAPHFNPHFSNFSQHGHRGGGGDGPKGGWNRNPVGGGNGPPLLHRMPRDQTSHSPVKPTIPVSSTPTVPSSGNVNNNNR